ncbi:MAG: HU family DNA-binding protein [Acidobacteriota bacterium]|nr:HU family DNA-binding protein [Acidobacteriota bacterium]MDQ7086362.1 HU family DNA-binding protein [Acidobacteriota bacterium]
MTRGEMIAELARRGGVTRLMARTVFDLLFGVGDDDGLMLEGLQKDGRVVVPGFGTFYLRRRGARVMIDPRTGRRRTLDAADVPAFRPAPRLRSRLR